MCEVCRGTNSHLCPICGDWSEPAYEECQECHGTGVGSYWAFDRRTQEEVKVTPTTYTLLPATEIEAITKNSWYYRSGTEPCEHCKGNGYVEADETDPDDYIQHFDND